MEKLTILKGLTQFSTSLYQGAAENSGHLENIIISPISIAIIYVMTLIGARGNTSSQMKKALNSGDFSDEVIGKTVATLVNQATEIVGGTFGSFNQISVSDEFPINDHFRSIMHRNFQSSPETVDFSSPGFADRINRQVLKFTDGRIRNFLPNNAVDSSTVMILLNAVDFKGKWLLQFRPSQTKLMPFHLNASRKRVVTVPMMRTLAAFRVANLYRLDTRVLELPYEGNEFSMLILLPNRVGGLQYLEKNVLSALLDGIDERMRLTMLNVAVPKFRTDASFDVKACLKDLGVTDLFDPKVADLGGISDAGGLHVSKTFHRTSFEVDESGSKASAATGMVVTRRSLYYIGNFIANRPFMYIIRHKHSRMILFIGRYVNP